MKKRKALFEDFTLTEIATKLMSSKKIQPMLNRTFEQMMKLKSRLDEVMPLALGVFNLPSSKDIRKLRDEVKNLNSKLESLSHKLVEKKKPRKRKAARKSRSIVHVKVEETKNTNPTEPGSTNQL